MGLHDHTCTICGRSTILSVCPKCSNDQYCGTCNHCNVCGTLPREQAAKKPEDE